MIDNFIYLDYNATNPLDERVLDAMLPYLRDQFGNASSAHRFGQKINKAVDKARQQISDLINANNNEVILTSGATESINLALKGIALSPANTKRHIVTVQTEHKAVLDTCKFLETLGFEVTYLPVQRDGLIDSTTFKNSLRADTLLACVMLVNNETGVVQDVKTLSAYCKTKGIVFMSDATQALGKIQVDVQELGIDVLAFSGHKFYGPKGIGALYVSQEIQTQQHLQALIHGGGHENGLRSGTLNVPAIVGLGKACEIAAQDMQKNEAYVGRLRDELEKRLLEIDGAFVNGTTSSRIFNTSSICFPGIDANVLIAQIPDMALSNGSACTAAIVEPSHVFTAMGLTEDEAAASVRFSLGKFNKENEIQYAVEKLSLRINALRFANK